MNLREKIFLFSTLAFLILMSPLNHAALAQQKDVPDTVIRTSTTFVQIHVSVEDRDGQAVTGLTREDFELKDNGITQKILSLTIPSPSITEISPDSEIPVFSNSVENFREEETNSIIILLDWVNTKLEEQIYARNQALEFIQKIPSGQKVELLVMDRNLRIIHDLTGNTRSLLDKIRTIGNPLMTDMDLSIFDSSTTSSSPGSGNLFSANSNYLEFQRVNAVTRTTDSFVTIANRMKSVPGRKILIWLSAGFPIIEDFHLKQARLPAQAKFAVSKIQAATKVLNEANIAVFPVDARGLSTDPNAHYHFPVMTEFASRTGGRVWINRNDLSFGMIRAVESSRSGYVLGYQLPESQTENREHRIQIKAKKPGLHLRYRKTYIEPKDQTGGQENEINQVLQSPFNWSSIPLALRAVRQQDNLLMQIKVGIGNVPMEFRNNNWTGTLNMVAQCFTASNQLAAPAHVGTLQLRLTPEIHQKALMHGLVLQQSMPVPKGCTLLRLIAHDTKNGRAGSVHVPLNSLQVVPAPAKQDGQKP